MAIEAHEFTEKDQLIAKFYTLRAGLSAVAEETKQIREQEKKKHELIRLDTEHREKVEDRLVDKKRELEIELEKEMSPQLARVGNLLWKKKQEYKGNCRELKNLNSPEAFKTMMETTNLNGWWILIIICALAFLGPLIAKIMHPVNQGPLDYVAPLFTGWLIALIIAIILGNLIRVAIAGKKLKKQRNILSQLVSRGEEQFTRDEQCQYDALQREKARKEKMIAIKIDNMVNDPDDADLFADLYKGDLQKIEEHIQTEVIPVHTARAQTITRALHQQFDSILTEADWGNIDLLIFYLNTGRADSLKEALQLVDRQRQTDQITRAIHDASQHIASTMQDNTYRLAKVMTGCFKELSSQIQVSHNAILASTCRTAEAVEQLTSSVSSLGSQIHSLSSSIENQNQTLIESKDLNAALLKQANRTSRDLMYELRYNQKYWQ